MSSLQSSFKSAMYHWRTKSPDEPPRHGFQAYDHFKDLGKKVETAMIQQGYGGLKVKVSVGMGSWADIPWIGMRHPELTDNFEEGVYVVYLFSPDYNRIYLALIQGVTKLTADELNRSTPLLRKEIRQPTDFVVGIEGKLSRNSRLNSNPDKYERGIIYSKKYDCADLPVDVQLERDLKSALMSYREYIDKNI